MASKETTTPDDFTPAGEISDRVLAGCRAGQADAQRQLYESCRQRVYRLMVRMVGPQDAEDVAQQVFLQVFRKIDHFAGHSRFETWLYRLAVNEALQYLRKGERWKFRSLVHEPIGHGERTAQDRERHELLERAMSQLEPDLLSIFVLREVEQLSYREIAEAVQIPEGTVGSRLNRARRELQQHLTRLGWEA